MIYPSAKILADSISSAGVRLTTFEVVMHRFILAEWNTHRMFSRNARSSRAVPIAKLIKEVRENPAMPFYWGKNRKGMGAGEELTGLFLEQAKEQWLRAADDAACHAEAASDLGGAKEWVNRMLEPYLYCYGVVSSTDYRNFFGLRLQKDAQPEIRALAEAMWQAYKASTPEQLEPGLWHLPYIEAIDYGYGEYEQTLIKVSAARCARASYYSFETNKRSSHEEDMALYDRLVSSGHFSPLEHQATPDRYDWHGEIWESRERWGNFYGWVQARKTIPGEDIARLPEGYNLEE